MNRKLFLPCLLALALFAMGCAQKAPSLSLPSFHAKTFAPAAYDSKVDNFIVILDASSSMTDGAHNGEKFAIAKALAHRLNQTLPELGQTGGLRTFGHHDAVSTNATERFYGMATYTSAGLASGLDKVTQAGGTSPMAKAIAATQADLKSLSGSRNAVVLITDGLDMEGSVKSAQALKNAFPDICFYPVQVGDKAEGRMRLQQIAKIGQCGFFSTADELLTPAGMAQFVEKAFLTQKAMKSPAKVMMKKDSDKDGVYDDMDKCPGTPMGARVNANGCWTLNNVLFDFDKAVIKPKAYPLLDEVVAILKKNPAMSVELQGHTDNKGPAIYNMDLSLRRAQAVAAYLVDKGILRNRMATTGFGFKKPVALNGTEYGRSLNRRVELHPY